MKYVEYNEAAAAANIVVDGSPNAGTVLTLTHWPGIAQPDGLAADLSTQMTFRLLHVGQPMPADVVTNNHFDQDGLVSMFALIHPDVAVRHEAILTDVAAAGDFATYTDRAAARASMAIWTYAQPALSPVAAQLDGPYEAQCAVLYETLLNQLLAMVLEPDDFRDLWEDEDARLTVAENALADGTVTIQEFQDLDLAVVRVDPAAAASNGHRFAADSPAGMHPMAINNATTCKRILQICGRHFIYTDRYETWVQYRSRALLPRVDLRPLADVLSAVEPGSQTWTASSPSSLTPVLESPIESSLGESLVLAQLLDHLATAPVAWDPYTVEQ